jgi:hypothetical protein
MLQEVSAEKRKWRNEKKTSQFVENNKGVAVSFDGAKAIRLLSDSNNLVLTIAEIVIALNLGWT